MSPTLIVVLVFIFLMAIISILSRNSTLDKLVYEQDEKEVAQLDKIKAEIRGMGPKVTAYPGARLVVTNKRIILAQKILGRDKYMLRNVVYYDGDNTRSGMGIKGGYLTMSLGRQCFKYSDKNDISEMIISPGQGQLLKEIKLSLKEPSSVLSEIFS